MAGAVDVMQALGQRLLADGYSTPFLNVPMSFMQENLDGIRSVLSSVGKQIRYRLPPNLPPIVFTFTGNGNVSQGAREIFENLPHEYISVGELPTLQADIKSGKRKNNRLYGVLTSAVDMVRRKGSQKNSNPISSFDKAHYYLHPEAYEPCFHETVIPYTTVLVNGMYWDHRFPRLLTKAQLRDLRSQGNHTLKVVADISCDVEGSCEFLSHCTTIEKPFFTYVPEDDSELDGVDSNGVLVLGVDILPSELPRDASHHFSSALLPLIPPLLVSTGSGHADDMVDLPPECVNKFLCVDVQ